MAEANGPAQPARHAVQGYPHVLRGLGLAMAVSLPSCAIATCGQAGFGPGARCTLIVDRKVTPDGTELCITQSLGGDGEPYTVQFNMRRPGETWNEFFLANDAFSIGEIRLLPGDRAFVVGDFGDHLLVDWRHGRRLPTSEDTDLSAPNGTPIDDPFARE
jgi:hypothetical protein